MCGIAGIVGRQDAVGEELVRGMLEAQRHRGPDDAGLYSDPEAGVTLGHRRLAVLDLSDAGRQPMASHDGRWVLTLNGEIFNYVELRAQLRGRFRTATDAEVLVEACAAWGVETALERSVGMFAFALWDTRARELILARDRVGEKPLVYRQDGNALAFGSELKALLGERRLDPAAVDAYLALGYVPAPLSIFRDCRKLPPGHLLKWKDGNIQIRRWWFPERIAARQVGDSAGRLREMVSDAVRLRLRADVPAALALSGGVDSSVIAAECRRQSKRPDAFTVCFAGQETEAGQAHRLAQALELPHEILRVPEENLETELERIVQNYDEPFADSSALPSLVLARALGGRYKVLLSGDGGDEAFGGYRHYEHIRVKQALKAAAVAVHWRDGNGGPLQVYVQSKSAFRAVERGRLLNGNASAGGLQAFLDTDPFLHQSPGAALHRALWSDRHLYLPNDLTYKMDIALASQGIEGRAPFLDHRLLEWTQTLAAPDLVQGREKKILLRSAYRRELPDQVLDRPKQGFGAPVSRWLRGPLRDAARDLVPCPLLDHGPQSGVTGQRLWSLLVFARWARQWRASW
jgi:asparagine synthase (glutamine-hydrolysing)